MTTINLNRAGEELAVVANSLQRAQTCYMQTLASPAVAVNLEDYVAVNQIAVHTELGHKMALEGIASAVKNLLVLAWEKIKQFWEFLKKHIIDAFNNYKNSANEKKISGVQRNFRSLLGKIKHDITERFLFEMKAASGELAEEIEIKKYTAGVLEAFADHTTQLMAVWDQENANPLAVCNALNVIMNSVQNNARELSSLAFRVGEQVERINAGNASSSSSVARVVNEVRLRRGFSVEGRVMDSLQKEAKIMGIDPSLLRHQDTDVIRAVCKHIETIGLEKVAYLTDLDEGFKVFREDLTTNITKGYHAFHSTFMDTREAIEETFAESKRVANMVVASSHFSKNDEVVFSGLANHLNELLVVINGIRTAMETINSTVAIQANIIGLIPQVVVKKK